MITAFLAATADAAPNQTDLIGMLTNASPIGLFAIFVVALLRRWLVLPREVDEREKRVRELEAERDEYKQMAFRLADLGERITSATERERDRP